MSILLVSTFGTLSILLGHFLFKKWFNHLSLYTLIWMTMIILYEMKLMPFLDLSAKTWFVVVGAFVSFLLGILTIFTARSVFPREKHSVIEHTKPALFLDGGKKILFLLVLFSAIGLFSSYQHWNALFNQYGSLGGIFLNAQKIYSGRISNEEVQGVIPYLWLFPYFGTLLGGLYSAYKRRVTFLSIIPVICIVLISSARFTRSGILFGLLEFIISFMLFRHYLTSLKEKKPISKSLVIATTVILITITVLGATLVKVLRNPAENFQGSSSTISQLNSGGIISPSVYFYAASQIGVFNIYLRDSNENEPIGNSTFITFYNFLSKFDVVQRPEVFQKGYFIPYWSNTATYLRDLHSDFGISGPLIIPYILGLLGTFFWFRLFESNRMINYVILVYIYLTIGTSFFILVTRFPAWLFGLFLFSIIIPYIEKANLTKITGENSV